MSWKIWMVVLAAVFSVSVKIAYAVSQATAVAAPTASTLEQLSGPVVSFYATLPPGVPVGP